MTLDTDSLQWRRDYVATAERFIDEDPVPFESDEHGELLSVKHALYARILTLFQGALLLIENDRQLDFRSHARGVIEATIYLLHLDQHPEFIQRMHDDDFRSRFRRANLHLNAIGENADPESIELLEDFVARGLQGARAVELSSLLAGNHFERLYRSFRDISGDTAHVSMTSLWKHVKEAECGVNRLIVHPELDEIELIHTRNGLGISVIIATLLIMKTKQQTATWDDFSALTERYRALVGARVDEASEGAR
jgi:hypothetical protein